MPNQIRVKKSYVDKVEQHFSKRSLKINHTSSCNSKTLDTISEGEKYINGLKYLLGIDSLPGADQFIRTLCMNIQFKGAGTSEFTHIEFKAYGKEGYATYVLVATNVDADKKVTVCHAYHAITEEILEDRTYTAHTVEMYTAWLKAKSCKSLLSMLPASAAPELIYET